MAPNFMVHSGLEEKAPVMSLSALLLHKVRQNMEHATFIPTVASNKCTMDVG